MTNPETWRVEEARELTQRVTSIIASSVGREYIDPETALITAESVLMIGVAEKLDGVNLDALHFSFKALQKRIKESSVDKPETALRGWKEKIKYSAGVSSPEKARVNYNVLKWRIVAPLLEKPITSEELTELAESANREK